VIECNTIAKLTKKSDVLISENQSWGSICEFGHGMKQYIPIHK
jgi:hypothetical protein